MTKALDKNIQYGEFNDQPFTSLEKVLMNDFQHNFPLSPQPFHEIADRYSVDVIQVLNIYERLITDGAISRIGPVIKPNTIGASLLAALLVPEEKLNEIAEMINAYPEVNHNYEREHKFNLWFVITAADDKRLEIILSEIKEKTGYQLLRLPLEEAFHIDLGFNLKWNQH